MPATLNFELTAGDALTIQLDHIEEATGLPRSLVGATIAWSFGKLESGRMPEQTLKTKTIGDGLAVTNASGGEWEIQLVSADTASLEGEFYHQARITDPAGPETVLVGRMLVHRSLING